VCVRDSFDTLHSIGTFRLDLRSVDIHYYTTFHNPVPPHPLTNKNSAFILKSSFDKITRVRTDKHVFKGIRKKFLN